MSRKKSCKMTQISISLPDTLVKQIDQLAAAENRNRSNFIANEMKKLAEQTSAAQVVERLGDE